MNKRNTIILGLLFIIIIVQIIVLSPKNVGLPPEPDDLEEQNPKPVKPTDSGGKVMRDFYLIQAKPEGREWELWAVKAAQPKDDERWSIEKVRTKFYAENGVIYTVTGQRGTVIPQQNYIRIEGDVITRSSNGYTFKTESVLYDSKARRLTSPQAVAMTGPKDVDGDPRFAEKSRLVLTGENMVADMGSNEITIASQVRAKKGIKNGKIATLQSQRAVFSGKSNLAHFIGNVVMDMETMRITGPDARFTYDPKTGQLNSVNVQGGARVTDTDKFATSQSVSVEFKDDRVVFNGSPRVVQNGDELVGDEIIFLDGGKKVRVSNAKAQIDPNTMEKKN